MQPSLAEDPRVDLEAPRRGADGVLDVHPPQRPPAVEVAGLLLRAAADRAAAWVVHRDHQRWGWSVTMKQVHPAPPLTGPPEVGPAKSMPVRRTVLRCEAFKLTPTMRAHPSSNDSLSSPGSGSRITGNIRSSGMIPVGDIDGGCSVTGHTFRTSS